MRELLSSEPGGAGWPPSLRERPREGANRPTRKAAAGDGGNHKILRVIFKQGDDAQKHFRSHKCLTIMLRNYLNSYGIGASWSKTM